MDRRQFLQSALYSSLLYGAGSLPRFVNEASAAFEPLQRRILVNMFLDGGPDMRHLVAPAFDSNPNSVGYQYWSHRWRAHDIADNPSAWQARWNNDYFHITVGGSNWGNSGVSIVDSGAKNSGVTFGIWKEAGWLIDMFMKGNAALAFNVAGGRNRAHDHSSMQLNQGNILSGLNDQNRSGWGGRLARSAQSNVIAVTNSPESFCYGPVGPFNNYNPNAIDNIDVVSVQSSREMGLNDFDPNQEGTDPFYLENHKMARALKSYYAALRQEQVSENYQKFMDHESKVRNFGEAIRARLEDVAVPDLIKALRYPIDIGGQPVNPGADGNARRVLRNGYSFGRQIANLYDVLAVNDVLEPAAVSMRYGGWDTHDDQRKGAGNSDVNNPELNRGIENGFKDLFGGPYADNPNALHSGFSALWQSMQDQGNVNRNNLVFTFAGEFGRQIRDNGRGGTDHGKANLMLVIGEQVNGGVYGEMFPTAELAKYALEDWRTPDIEPLTDIDYLFSSVCDWVSSGSGNQVFPRLTNSSLPPSEQAILESGVTFQQLFS